MLARGSLWMACDWGSLCCGLAGCLCAKTGAAETLHRGHFHLNASLSKIAFRGSLGLVVRVSIVVCSVWCVFRSVLAHLEWSENRADTNTKLLAMTGFKCCAALTISVYGAAELPLLEFDPHGPEMDQAPPNKSVLAMCCARGLSRGRLKLLASACLVQGLNGLLVPVKVTPPSRSLRGRS